MIQVTHPLSSCKNISQNLIWPIDPHCNCESLAGMFQTGLVGHFHHDCARLRNPGCSQIMNLEKILHNLFTQGIFWCIKSPCKIMPYIFPSFMIQTCLGFLNLRYLCGWCKYQCAKSSLHHCATYNILLLAYCKLLAWLHSLGDKWSILPWPFSCPYLTESVSFLVETSNSWVLHLKHTPRTSSNIFLKHIL